MPEGEAWTVATPISHLTQAAAQQAPDSTLEEDVPLTLSLCGAGVGAYSDLRVALALTGHDVFRPTEALLFRS